VVLIPTKGDPEAVALNDLLKKDSEDRLRDATIVLPRDTGGLDSQGMLDGSEKSSVIDVADRSAQPQDVREGSQTSSDPERLRIVVGRDPETEEWSARRIDTDNALELGSDATATVKAS